MPRDLKKEYGLDELDREELVKLRGLVDEAIESVEKRRLKEATDAARKLVLEYGFDLEDIMAGGRRGKSATGKPKAPPKYVHPEDPEKTWTGKGRKPQWITEHLESGKELDVLLIKK